VRTAQTAQTVSPYTQGCEGGVPQSPGSCPESESDSKSASKSSTPTPGTRPVSSVVLGSNGRPVDRRLIKNVENFYFLFDGFPYVIAPVFSTLAFSAPPFCASLRQRPRSQTIGHWCDRTSSDVITYRLTSFSRAAKCFPSSTVVAILRMRISMHTVRMRRTATVTASPEPVFTLNVCTVFGAGDDL